ncbi:MAG TPA: 50S ribosomal protein L16 [Euryarchaeota archaeon]|nr:MAG: 50S ribosomal protein L16 [Thermoplasmatales archaeon ex4484_6]RLF67390.1 MAG: 50S ribosomal protein L16 [Thermoplasmata archaeon]HHD15147.1 50S ribosomal protein L16 [Euryarchaeota archaeon]
MARKPNRMYRQIRGQAFTRKDFTGGIPAPRIQQFVSGNRKMAFPITYHLVVKEQCQIRHTALEAARIAANKYISKRVGAQNYRLIIRVYPHQILRENKQATGAGADRVSQGMRKSFGKNVGTAARVKSGQEVITLQVPAQMETHAKIALRKASQKLPSPVSITMTK